MTDKAKLYKKGNDTAVAEKDFDDGQSSAVVTLDDIASNTDVAAGAYQASVVVNGVESDKVDVAAFKTLAPPKVAVTGVTATPTTLSGKVGGTGEITYAVAPENATDKTIKSVTSSDDAIATVVLKDGKATVTYVKAGTADITGTTNDGGNTAKTTVTITAE